MMFQIYGIINHCKCLERGITILSILFIILFITKWKFFEPCIIYCIHLHMISVRTVRTKSTFVMLYVQITSFLYNIFNNWNYIFQTYSTYKPSA